MPWNSLGSSMIIYFQQKPVKNKWEIHKRDDWVFALFVRCASHKSCYDFSIFPFWYELRRKTKEWMGNKEVKTAGVAWQTSLAWALLRAGSGVCWETLQGLILVRVPPHFPYHLRFRLLKLGSSGFQYPIFVFGSSAQLIGCREALRGAAVTLQTGGRCHLAPFCGALIIPALAISQLLREATVKSLTLEWVVCSEWTGLCECDDGAGTEKLWQGCAL